MTVLAEDNQFRIAVHENGAIEFKEKYLDFPYCSYCGNFERNLSEHWEYCHEKNIRIPGDLEYLQQRLGKDEAALSILDGLAGGGSK